MNYIKLNKWIKQPYYLHTSTSYKITVSFSLFIADFVFLNLFKPFKIASLGDSILYVTLGYSLIMFIVILSSLILLPKLIPKAMHENSWNIGKHILLVSFNLSLISILSWYYNDIIQINDESSTTFFEMVGYTFSIGLFLIILYLFIDEKYRREKSEKIAKEINEINTKNKFNNNLENVVQISSEETKESYSINVNDIIYITAEGNYACVFLKNKDKINELIIRTTLSKINKQLNKNKNIIRCHKSYIINAKYINRISGNARGYQLHSERITFSIPVSRKFKKEDLIKLIT